MRLVDRAVPVGVAQEGNLVALLLLAPAAMGHRHDEAANHVLGPGHGFAGGAARLDHQDVAVRQRVHVARVGQPRGVGGDLQSFGHGGCLAVGPADHLGHFHVSDQAGVRVGQDRIRPDLLRHVELLGVTQAGRRKCDAGACEKGAGEK